MSTDLIVVTWLVAWLWLAATASMLYLVVRAGVAHGEVDAQEGPGYSEWWRTAAIYFVAATGLLSVIGLVYTVSVASDL